jgi:ubiquinone/menaquinone biosynthesis C-methylase UbiE
MMDSSSKNRTDYRGVHENVYKRLRADGEAGWSSPADRDVMCDLASRAMAMCSIQVRRSLELGCGDGGVSIALSRRGLEVHGIDIVPAAVEWGAEKADESNADANFLVGSVTRLPYRGGSFGMVLDALCSHCIIGADRKEFFSEAYRVLKTGGILVSNCMCGDPAPEVRKFFDPVTRCLVRQGISGRYIGRREDIMREVEEAGFALSEHWTEMDPEGQEELFLIASR